MSTSTQKQPPLIEEFDQSPESAEADLAGRPITASAGKIIAGAAIIDVLTFVFSLGGSGSASWIGCLIGLVAARLIVFRKANALDHARWRRYWHGDVLGYWLLYVPMLLVWVGPAIDRGDVDTVDSMMVETFVVASIGGLAIGFLNVCLRDKADKAKISESYHQGSKSGQASAAQES